jgi:hypothetical protein
MSLRCKPKIQFIPGQKNASKYNGCKLKAIVWGWISAAFHLNEIHLVSQRRLMDLLNTLRSQVKAGVNFSLASEKGQPLLFSNFCQAIHNIPNRSKRDSFLQTPRFLAMFRKVQEQQRKQPQ